MQKRADARREGARVATIQIRKLPTRSGVKRSAVAMRMVTHVHLGRSSDGACEATHIQNVPVSE